LRRLPLSESEIEAMRSQLALVNDRCKRLFFAPDALGYVAAKRQAPAWTDAEESLSARLALVPWLGKRLLWLLPGR
jgi:hypothetical protein